MVNQGIRKYLELQWCGLYSLAEFHWNGWASRSTLGRHIWKDFVVNCMQHRSILLVQAMSSCQSNYNYWLQQSNYMRKVSIHFNWILFR